MPAQATTFTYSASAAEVAAMQVKVDILNNPRAPATAPDPLWTVESYFQAQVALLLGIYVASAIQAVSNQTVSTFGSLTLDQKIAILMAIGVTVDPALLA